MKALWVVGASLIAVGGVLYYVLNRATMPSTAIEVSKLSSTKSLVRHDEPTSAGLCPWREQDADRRRWFPGSTSSRDETLVLSRHRMELISRLGRMPSTDDNALIVHQIVGSGASPGVVVTRRVRGEYGLIELALAVNSKGRVLGAGIQRHREPDSTAKALQSKSWLGAFRGKDCNSRWTLGEDIPSVRANARASAQAILKEARSVLILLDVASGGG